MAELSSADHVGSGTESRVTTEDHFNNQPVSQSKGNCNDEFCTADEDCNNMSCSASVDDDESITVLGTDLNNDSVTAPGDSFNNRSLTILEDDTSNNQFGNTSDDGYNQSVVMSEINSITMPEDGSGNRSFTTSEDHISIHAVISEEPVRNSEDSVSRAVTSRSENYYNQMVTVSEDILTSRYTSNTAADPSIQTVAIEGPSTIQGSLSETPLRIQGNSDTGMREYQWTNRNRTEASGILYMSTIGDVLPSYEEAIARYDYKPCDPPPAYVELFGRSHARTNQREDLPTEPTHTNGVCSRSVCFALVLFFLFIIIVSVLIAVVETRTFS